MDRLTIQEIVEIEKFVFAVFSNVKDKGGLPYKIHLMTVKNNACELAAPFGIEYIDFDTLSTLATCHDLKEDFPEKWEELKTKYPKIKGIESSLNLVTRNKKNTYSEFIDSICESKDVYAVIVKLADNMHNNTPHRLVVLSEEERGISRRYDKAFKKLKAAYFDLYDNREKYEKNVFAKGIF